MPAADPQKCEAHSEAIETLKDSDKRQWDTLDRIMLRPPVWCTIVISLLTFALGFTAAIKVNSTKATALHSTAPISQVQTHQGEITR